MRRTWRAVVIASLTAVTASVAAQVASGPPPPEAQSDDFVPLITGNSLAGWIVEHPAADRVRVAAGMLRVTEPAGWVRTERTTFDRFVLRFDMEAPSPSADAVLVLFGISPSNGRPGSGHALPLLGRALTHEKPMGDMRLIWFPLNPTGVAHALRPKDEWQAYEIIRRDDKVNVTLNGALILDQKASPALDGWIGIHTEGAPVALRNMRIRPFAETPLKSVAVFRPGNDVTLPRLLYDEKPQYTPEAQAAKIQGTVLLECMVGTDGTVQSAKVIRSLDSEFGLDEQAIMAAQNWRFEPGMRLGQPVPVMVTIELTFTLKK